MKRSCTSRLKGGVLEEYDEEYMEGWGSCDTKRVNMDVERSRRINGRGRRRTGRKMLDGALWDNGGRGKREAGTYVVAGVLIVRTGRGLDGVKRR